MNVSVLDESGARTGDVELRDEIFAAKVNVPLMHQVVTAQLAAARSGTHSTKTRGDVRGGGKKPWRQKGTGRARHGSIREPQWVGGGIAHGPQPRSHAKNVNKKMRALALRSALSARAGEQRVLVVEDLAFDVPKTKRALKALQAWQVEGKVLVVLGPQDGAVAYSFRNIPLAHVITEDQLNTYDVLNAATVIFARSALEAFQERAAQLPGRRAAAERRAADVEEPEPAQSAAEEGVPAVAAPAPPEVTTTTPGTTPDPGGEVTP